MALLRLCAKGEKFYAKGVSGLAESAMEVPTQAALGWGTQCGGGTSFPG
jgi:hypothetical protein